MNSDEELSALGMRGSTTVVPYNDGVLHEELPVVDLSGVNTNRSVVLFVDIDVSIRGKGRNLGGMTGLQKILVRGISRSERKMVQVSR